MSKEAMKLATEFNRYFTSMNGVDVPERVSVPRDEWRALFAALAEQPAQHPDDLSDAEFLSKRLSRVAKLVGVPMPDKPHDEIAQLAGTILGSIAWKLEKAQPAQQEPVATLWQHGETGRTRITMPGDITDCDARWFKAADLYTSPPAQRKPLTPDQIEPIAIDVLGYGAFREQDLELFTQSVRAIEAAHGIKEKNT